MFEIEKNVPMPKGRGRNKYNFHMMEVGDSFLVAPWLEADKARSAAYSWGKLHGKKFKSQRKDNSLRIWRSE